MCTNIFTLYQSLMHQFSTLLNLGDVSQNINDISSANEILFNLILTDINLKQFKVIILLDAIDQLDPHEYGLTWIPKTLPKNVKLIVSMTSYTNKTAIEIVRDKLGLNEENYFELSNIKLDDALNELKFKLNAQQRDLQPTQWDLVESCLSGTNKIYPLHVKLLLDITIKWHSTYIPIEDSVESLDKCISIKDTIKCLFEKYEQHYGLKLFSHLVFYITIFKIGISEVELEDVLSLDDDVLNEAFEKHEPPVRRFPIAIWIRIRDDLKSYLSLKLADKTPVVSWTHQVFTETAKEYYKELFVESEKRDKLLINIIDYFNEEWRKKPKDYEFNGKNKSAVRHTKSQNLKYKIQRIGEHVYNERKLNELLNVILLLSNKKLKLDCLTDMIYLNYQFMRSKAELNELRFIYYIHRSIVKLNDIIGSDTNSDNEIKIKSQQLVEISNIYINNFNTIIPYPDSILYHVISRISDEAANKMRKSVSNEFALIPLQNKFNEFKSDDSNTQNSNKTLLSLGTGSKMYGFVGENHLLVKSENNIKLSIIDVFNQRIESTFTSIAKDDVVIAFNRKLIFIWGNGDDHLRVLIINNEFKMLQINDIQLDFKPYHVDAIKCYDLTDDSAVFTITALNIEKTSIQVNKCSLTEINNQIQVVKEECNEYLIEITDSNQDELLQEAALVSDYCLTHENKYLVYAAFILKATSKPNLKACIHRIYCINTETSQVITKAFNFEVPSQYSCKARLCEIKKDNDFIFYDYSNEFSFCYHYKLSSNYELIEVKIDLDDGLKCIQIFNDKFICFKYFTCIIFYNLIECCCKKFVVFKPDFVCSVPNSNYFIITQSTSPRLIRVVEIIDQNKLSKFQSMSMIDGLRVQTDDLFKNPFERSNTMSLLKFSSTSISSFNMSLNSFDNHIASQSSINVATTDTNNPIDKFRFLIDSKSLCCNKKYVSIELDHTHQLITFLIN